MSVVACGGRSVTVRIVTVAMVLAVGAVRRTPWEHHGEIALRDVLTALRQLDKLLTAERELRHTQIAFMLTLKNELTPEQQKEWVKLRANAMKHWREFVRAPAEADACVHRSCTGQEVEWIPTVQKPLQGSGHGAIKAYCRNELAAN